MSKLKAIIVLSSYCLFFCIFLTILCCATQPKKPTEIKNEIFITIDINENPHIEEEPVFTKEDLFEKLSYYHVENKYTDLIYEKSIKYNVPLDIMYGIGKTESKFKEKANSFLGAEYGRGLFQISEIVLKDYNLYFGTEYEPNELYNPEINIEIAAWAYNRNRYYLRSLDEVTDDLLIMAFNMGAFSIKSGNYNYDYLNKVISSL